MTHVPADGPLDARLVLIGEAPGRNEVEQGKPFVGPSGALLRQWWHEVGLARKDFWIDNVYPYMAPGSNITKAPIAAVEAHAASLHDRLMQLTGPVVIVPTGNLALRTLMRVPLWKSTSAKITDWRGSICSYTTNDGRTIKMIPTIHPAAVFRDPNLAKLCQADWQFIAAESKFPELCLPTYKVIINPKDDAPVQRYIDMARTADTVMAVDIENPNKRMACVGFSYDALEALVLKWPDDYEAIKLICEAQCAKVGQNFLFDRWWLCPPDGLATLARKHWGMDVLPDIRMGGKIYDLLAMHHVIDSTLPHDLATMASLYTRQPYWKKSWKDSESDTFDKTPFEKLCAYNGIDCCVTRELFDVFETKLRHKI